ncbi:response regulator transcription factor [Bacillus altitudinis]|uniref:response regulator transcription factor n=1 Tax=Bacillus altitudinis TaxID=293387 RepID=UPI0037EBF658|nr:response regulator transcription factor [Bacillus altitudinis]
MKEQMNILIVDDELDMLELIGSFLQRQGFHVITANNGTGALHQLEKEAIDLVVLDIMMPDMDGFEVCQRIRQTSQIPILFLTARSYEEDRIKGLEIGADDYIMKPFSLRELAARIETTLRRIRGLSLKRSRIMIGDLEIDQDSRQVYLKQEPINLTRREFDLLMFLLLNQGQVFSREQLYQKLWESHSPSGSLRTVDTHIKTLRLKLKEAERYIKTVWGVGYKFEEDK